MPYFYLSDLQCTARCVEIYFIALINQLAKEKMPANNSQHKVMHFQLPYIPGEIKQHGLLVAT